MDRVQFKERNQRQHIWMEKNMGCVLMVEREERADGRTDNQSEKWMASNCSSAGECT